VLLLRTKTVTIGDASVTLYSFDSKLWFSKPADFANFRQRRAEIEASLRVFTPDHDPRALPTPLCGCP
jgi:hypothetical protein